MLMAVGKLSSRGEMLTIRLAASKPPGDRHRNVVFSVGVSVHLGGTLHDIPCTSHFAVPPPASAAVWAAVGVAFSAPMSSPPELVAVLPGALELDEGFSLLDRLQSESANPSTSRTGICFMVTLTRRN